MYHPLQNSDWSQLDGGIFIPYDLESYPLQLKTASTIGSGDMIFIGFTTPNEVKEYQWSLRIHLTLSPRLEIKIPNCTNDDAKDIEIPKTVPEM